MSRTPAGSARPAGCFPRPGCTPAPPRPTRSSGKTWGLLVEASSPSLFLGLPRGPPGVMKGRPRRPVRAHGHHQPWPLGSCLRYWGSPRVPLTKGPCSHVMWGAGARALAVPPAVSARQPRRPLRPAFTVGGARRRARLPLCQPGLSTGHFPGAAQTPASPRPPPARRTCSGPRWARRARG